MFSRTTTKIIYKVKSDGDVIQKLEGEPIEMLQCFAAGIATIAYDAAEIRGKDDLQDLLEVVIEDIVDRFKEFKQSKEPLG